jgi:hypothetical protein
MNLENLNLVELSAQEKRETEGGLAPLVWGIIICCCLLMASSERKK